MEFSGTELFAKVLIILLALPAHEAAHATMAYFLGDDTAKRLGRVSLNPLRHLDPMGTLLLLIPGSLIGWAKPTPFNAARLRGSRSLGSALIYLAGPLSNFAQAVLWAGLLRGGLALGLHHRPTLEVLLLLLQLNLALGIFNLIPLPPLDGFGAASQLAAGEMRLWLEKIQRTGFLILFAVILLDNFAGTHYIGQFIGAMTQAISRWLLGQ